MLLRHFSNVGSFFTVLTLVSLQMRESESSDILGSPETTPTKGKMIHNCSSTIGNPSAYIAIRSIKLSLVAFL